MRKHAFRLPLHLFGLPLLLCLTVAPLRADLFQITFLPGPVETDTGTGSFTTDGVCMVCTPGAGLLTFSAELIKAEDTGSKAWDIVDDIGASNVKYVRSTNDLSIVPGLQNSETNDFLTLSNGAWGNSGTLTFGSYTVAAVTPEPGAFVPLLAIAVLWMAMRRRRIRA